MVGIAKPVEAAQEKSESKQPTDACGGEYAAPALGRASVDEPDQDRKRDKKDRPEVEWRQGHGRYCTGAEGDDRAPPPRRLFYSLGKKSEKHQLPLHQPDIVRFLPVGSVSRCPIAASDPEYWPMAGFGGTHKLRNKLRSAF